MNPVIAASLTAEKIGVPADDAEVVPSAATALYLDPRTQRRHAGVVPGTTKATSIERPSWWI